MIQPSDPADVPGVAGAVVAGTRRVMMMTHTGRDEAREVALAAAKSLADHGLVVRMPALEAAELGIDAASYEPPIEICETAEDCELALVIGGDGTILRAAELTHESGTPVLGVNLGHVGFLAEAEHDAVEFTIDAIVHRRYQTEDRLTLEVRVVQDNAEIFRTFAMNEASVEKASRERMIEVIIEVDGRPLSRFGCDGVVCATPTGSTAYNFSAGGPVVWPSVEALLMVPISAHALFARPLVVSPDSVLAVEMIKRNDGSGVLWCDGRRSVPLPPGARIEVSRGAKPVRLVRLHQAPFTDRLVAKFNLPVDGWRGERFRSDSVDRGGDAGA
ncbi:MAG: NAD kinase [Nocardioides sp.]